MAGQDYTKGSILNYTVQLASITAIGLSAMFVVDLVDMIFISMLGESALVAAVGYSGTLLFLAASVCMAASVATSALVGRKMGAHDTEGAAKTIQHAAIIGLVISVILAIIMAIIAPTVLENLGAKGETLANARSYFAITNWTFPILFLAIAGSGVLRASGMPRASMMGTIAGGVVNAVLDPIFIFVFGWGIEGAALASAISRFAIVAVVLYNIFKADLVHQKLDLSGFFGTLREMTGLFVPAMLTNLATPIGSTIVIAALAQYGDGAVAASSVIGRITPVAFVGVLSLSAAASPLMNQNFGAGNLARLRESQLTTIGVGVAYTLVVWVILFALQGVLVDAFDLSGEGADLLRLYCTVLSLLYMFYGFNLVSNEAFVATKHPFYASATNIARDLIVLPLAVTAGGAWFGAQGILVGQYSATVIAGVVSFAVSQWMLARMMRGEATGKDSLPQPTRGGLFHRPVHHLGNIRGH